MRAAGILHFAAQQAGTCRGMQWRQQERDRERRNEQRREMPEKVQLDKRERGLRRVCCIDIKELTR